MSYLILGITFGLSIQASLHSLLFLPVIMVYLFANKVTLRYYGLFLASLTLGMFPYVLYLGQRLFGTAATFFSLFASGYPATDHAVTGFSVLSEYVASAQSTLQTFDNVIINGSTGLDTLTAGFRYDGLADFPIPEILFVAAVAYLSMSVLRHFRQGNSHFHTATSDLLILLWVFIPLGALFYLRQNIPHYFIAIFPASSIVVAALIGRHHESLSIHILNIRGRMMNLSLSSRTIKSVCLLILIVWSSQNIWIFNSFLSHLQNTGGRGWYGVTFENRKQAAEILVNDAVANSLVVLVSKTFFPPCLYAYSFLLNESARRKPATTVTSPKPVVLRLGFAETLADVVQILTGNDLDQRSKRVPDFVWVYYLLESDSTTRLQSNLEAIATSVIRIGPQRILIYKVKFGTEEKEGIGDQITLIRDGNLTRVQTKYSYLRSSNITDYSEEETHYLEVSGGKIYSISDYPRHWSYDSVSPHPSNLYVDADDVISFDGSKDVVYTIRWRANSKYRFVGWKDDSFRRGWIFDQAYIEIDGAILTFTTKKGVTKGYVERTGLNIDLNKYPMLIVRAKASGTYRIELLKGEALLTSMDVDASEEYRTVSVDVKSLVSGSFDTLRFELGGEDKTLLLDYVMFAGNAMQDDYGGRK